jgi:hypothetical protein
MFAIIPHMIADASQERYVENDVGGVLLEGLLILVFHAKVPPVDA